MNGVLKASEVTRGLVDHPDINFLKLCEQGEYLDDDSTSQKRDLERGYS
jgi:hypothetical protein